MLEISVIHNFATVKPKTLKLCKMIHLAAPVYVISLISLKTLPDGHICIRCIVALNALREVRVVENFHLGSNSQSEHFIQQMNRSETKGQRRKAAWVNMGL